MQHVKFSIITVVFNGEKYIQETIDSVLEQTYSNIQYIIIDGASTDSTNDIIKLYKNQIDCYISEKDNGMYEAINKGLKLATGDYILILNSDDYLATKNVLSELNGHLNNKSVDFFYCNLIRNKNNTLRYIKLKKYSFVDVLCSMHGTFIPHPTLFVSANFLKLNKLQYNLTFKYASDFDFILNCLNLSKNYSYIKLYTSVFREHSESITSSGKIDVERIAILNKWHLHKINFISRSFRYYKNWIVYKIFNLK